MRLAIIILIILIGVAILFDPFNSGAEIRKISPEDAKKNMESNSEIVLLDVRTQEEYEEIHIPGSLLIPLDKLENNIENEIKDKSKTIYVYCRSGNRSVSAVKILNKLGYENVYDLGGINRWPYETVSSK